MSNKNKLIPKRRFKEFENAESWEQRKLGEIGEIQTGNTPPTVNPKNYSEEGMLWVTPTDIEELVITNTAKRISELGQKKARIASKGSVLVTCIASIGKNTLLKEDAAFNQQINSITPTEEYDSYFLLTQSFNLSKKMVNSAAAATMQIVNKSQFSNFKMTLPIYNEQVKIGELFQYIDNLITLHQRKLNKLEEIKAAYLNEMFPIKGEFKPKRRFSGFEEDWNWIPLKEIGNSFTGLSGKTKEDFGHGDAKFITYMNVFSNPISDLNGLENIEIDKKQSQVNYGDVLFTTSSETPEEVGMSSVWLGNEEDVYLNSFCFGFRPSVEIDKYYLAYMLRSSPIRKKFQILAQGISRYNISKNKVMEISIPLPCMDEQKKIGLLFKNIEQTIYSQKKTVEKLRNIKNAYLNEIFV